MRQVIEFLIRAVLVALIWATWWWVLNLPLSNAMNLSIIWGGVLLAFPLVWLARKMLNRDQSMSQVAWTTTLNGNWNFDSEHRTWSTNPEHRCCFQEDPIQEVTVPRTNDSDDGQDVLAIIESEVKAAASGDAATYLGILDGEATFLPPNLAAKHGVDLRRWLREFLERFEVEWIDFVHENVEVAGDVAYHRYSYGWRVTPRAGGGTTVAHGKGLHILRRSPSGGWKILYEIWNASPAPDTPVE
jgi:ketosteroid isomerase-like protein